MSDDDRSLQHGFTPGSKAMKPREGTRRPTEPPPRPEDIARITPPPPAAPPPAQPPSE